MTHEALICLRGDEHVRIRAYEFFRAAIEMQNVLGDSGGVQCFLTATIDEQ